MQQYNDLMKKIINEGEWIYNERTGKKCKVIINADLEFDFCPLVTTRKSYWKSAVAEFVGYIRGYDNAEDFRKLGTKTWDANANENSVWLNSPFRKGVDDMGRVYGVQGRSWKTPDYYMAAGSGYISEDENNINPQYIIGTPHEGQPMIIDQLAKIYNNLKNGVDDRGEILSFYNVGEFNMGCLRPCVHTHTFSLVNGVLHLTSYQRSCDVPLGLNFNMVQCYFFLQLMAQITGHKAGKVYLKIVNAHIYEDQYETALIEAARVPIDVVPVMSINPRIKTLEDVETIFTLDDVAVENYKHHDPLNYPMSV